MDPVFVHLRMHSEYSVTDSIVRLDDAIARVKGEGVGALGLTDNNNIFGGLIFYSHARKAGVKPVLGCDFVIENPANRDKPYRMAVLCMNRTGYGNLCKVLSRAWITNQYLGQGQTKMEWLISHNDGLILLSGGFEGPFASLCIAGKTKEAAKLALRFKEAFGDRFYFEIHRAGRALDEAALRYSLALAAQLEQPVVATHPIEFMDEKDFADHDARVCIARVEVIADKSRPQLYTREQFMPTAQAMVEKFADIPSAIANSVEIAKRCSLEDVLSAPRLPLFPTPNGESLDDYIDQLSHEGLEKRLAFLYPDAKEREAQRPRYEERLAFELDIIKKMKFPGYFLIVQDFINWSKQNGVAVGPGRGSGAGSLVAYSLRITDMDPLRYDLLFERFLNPERVSMPDFDVDFCQFNRQKTINYVKSLYGDKAVSQIATFGTMGAKGVVRDVGRVMGLSYSLCDKVSRLIPAPPGKTVTLDDAIETVPELKEWVARDEVVRNLIERSKPLEGLVRNIGMHAGGVLIAPGKLTDFCPLYAQDENPDNVISQFDKKDVENVGLVKFDFLGLTTLTILTFACDFVKELDPSSSFDLEKIPLDDKDVFALFDNANTAAVFQFESAGMQNLLRQAHPDKLEDLIALNALYRPGPMDLIPDYIRRKNGEEEVCYPDASLVDVLKETYGIMVYQEQVMRVAQIVGGFSLGKADILRRAMGKKQVDVMKSYRVEFIAGAAKNHISEDRANELFDLMEKFAGYGFNKSHACAYAFVAYQTAYMKVHYPAPFMAANMCLAMNQGEKLAALASDCLANGISVLRPDVNESRYYFHPTSMTAIRYGLGGIKSMPEESAKAIEAERRANGPFANFMDFVTRIDRTMLSNKVLEGLIHAGAFDSIEPDRAMLLADIDKALSVSEKQTANAMQDSLFGEDFGAMPIAHEKVAPLSAFSQLTHEQIFLGSDFSGHLFAAFEDEIRSLKVGRIANVRHKKTVRNNTVVVAGVVSDIRTGVNKEKNEMFGTFTLDDATGTIMVSVYGPKWSDMRNVLEEGECVLVNARTREDRFSTGGVALSANNVETAAQMRAKAKKTVLIRVTGVNADFDKLRDFLLEHSPKIDHAGCAVAIELEAGGYRGHFKLEGTWKVYASDRFFDDLRALPGLSAELI